MELKIYFTKDDEHFVTGDEVLANPFATSLADFLYLDFSQDDAWSHTFFAGVDVSQLSAAKKKQLIADATALQKKLETLFYAVFDAIYTEHTMQENLAWYSQAKDIDPRFSFSDLTVRYERMQPNLFAEVLYP